MLDLRRMMLLCDLAELGTVTAVADRRSITSSAVSQQLRVLEEEAGATLFRRDGRTLGLTRGGVVLADHARRVLGAVDEAMSAVAATADRNSGQLVVASFNLGIGLLVAPLLERLAVTAPDIGVHVRQQGRPGALRMLRQGEIDLAVTCTYPFGAHESLGGLTSVPLLSEALVLLAPAALHASLADRGPQVLAEIDWITGPSSSGLSVALARFGESAGFTPRIRHRMVGARNICELAAVGAGAAIVPALAIDDPVAHLIVESVELEDRQITAVVRSGRQHDPTTAIALDALAEIAQEVGRPIPPPVLTSAGP